MQNHQKIFDMPIMGDMSLTPKYNIEGLPLYLSKEKLSYFPGLRTAPHWNDDLETIYVKSGSMEVVISGKPVVLNEHDICVIDSGCIHYFKSHDNSDCTYFCGLTNESLFTYSMEVKKKYIDPFFHSFHPNYVIISADSPCNETFHKIFLEIVDIIDKPNSAYELMLVAKLHEYLAVLYDTVAETFILNSPMDTRNTDAFIQILQYIHGNIANKLTIDELCDAGNVSRNHCFDLFHEFTDSTPANYILRYRIDYARTLLKDTEMPISHIADACGFSHQSHLTSHFSKRYGITPSRYRKQVQNHI